MSQTDTGPNDVVYTRVFNAPRQLVFECLTMPEHLTHFWGPTGVSTPLDRIVMDVRPGGEFTTVMVNDADSSEYASSGVYVEIDEPERIVWKETESGVVTTSTLNDLGDGRTEVRIHQVDVPDMYRSPEAQAGFQTSLDRFDAHLASLTGPGR